MFAINNRAQLTRAQQDDKLLFIHISIAKAFKEKRLQDT